MNKKYRLALGACFLGTVFLLPTQSSGSWWGGDRWRDRDRDWWYDGPGYYRGGPGYWGGGPGGWGGPGYWGGGPWGWGGYPGYYGYPYGAAAPSTSTSKSTPPPVPE